MAGNWPRALLSAFLIIATVLLASVNDFWIGYISSRDDQLSRMTYYFGIYGLIMLVGLFFEAARECNRQLFGIKVSRSIHKKVLHRVMRAPVNKFFDVTPVGRILNRFSGDIARVDHESHHSMHSLIFSNAWLFYQIGLACALNLWSVLPIPLLIYVAYKYLRYYQPANQELTRLENTTRSPIFQHLGEMVSGSSTIRAFGKEDEFNRKMKTQLDKNMSVGIINRISSSLFTVGLFNIAFVFLVIASMLIVQFKDYWSTAVIGLVLTYMMNITGSIRWVFWNAIWNEKVLISYERLLNYCDIVQEAPETIPDKDPKDTQWPRDASI